MFRFTLPTGARSWPTSEVDHDDDSDGGVETDDGPGVAWSVSCRLRPGLLEGIITRYGTRAGRPTVDLPEAPLRIGRSDGAEMARLGRPYEEQCSETSR